MSWPSLTNLAGSTAVPSLPVPTAAVRRGARRHLARPPVHSVHEYTHTSRQHWARGGKPHPPHPMLRKPALSPSSPSASAPQTTHDIPTVPFIPEGSLLCGEEGKARELSPFAPSIGLEEQRECAPSPAPLPGRGDILASFAPGAPGSSWHWLPAAAAATLLQQPSRPSTAPLQPHTPRHQGSLCSLHASTIPSSSECHCCHPSASRAFQQEVLR